MNVEEKFAEEYPSLYTSKLNQLFKTNFTKLNVIVPNPNDPSTIEDAITNINAAKTQLTDCPECEDNQVPKMVRNYILLQKLMSPQAKFQLCLGPNPNQERIKTCTGKLASQPGGKRYRKKTHRKTHRRKNKRNKKSRRR